jgi:3-phosphoshikimate 1-carboxyvinyltransferase
MNVTITPAKLHGSITPPPSKSQAHRLIIAGALAQGQSVISNVALSQDIEATLACMKALGAGAQVDGSAVTISGVGTRRTPSGSPLPHLDCGESGSTLRFLIPVALAVAGGAAFTGRGRLLSRPQQPYADLFAEKGISFTQESQVITASGNLNPGTYSLPGDVSSQFVTGLLYALPLLDGDSDIVLTSPLESKGYVDMTLLALAAFGVQAQETERGYHIPGSQVYRAASLSVESDYSQAGFYFAMNGVGNDLDVQGLNEHSAQGDRVIVPYSQALRAPGEVTLDVSQCPDLVPPLAAQAALRGAGHVTHLVGAARLRIKESDRLATVTQVLNAMGSQVEEHPDSLTITGSDVLRGGVTVDSFNDHRIAMMAAVAATGCERPVTITGAQCVAKSYPNFWEDYEALGGRVIRSEV